MKRIGLLSVTFAAMLAVVACGGNNRQEDANKPANDAAVGTAGSSEANRPVNNAAKTWLEDRIKDNMAEVKLGELAEKKAQNADVKAFGRMMVQDHTKATDELKQTAAKRNVEVPIDVGPDHAKTADNLQEEKQGRDFDLAYINAMIDGHQSMLENLEDRLDKSGDDKAPHYAPKSADDPFDAELNQWAAQAAPVVRTHLEKAKSVKEMLDRRTTTR